LSGHLFIQHPLLGLRSAALQFIYGITLPIKKEPKFGSSLPYGFQANNLQRIPINIPSIFIIYSSFFVGMTIYIRGRNYRSIKGL